MNRFMKKTTLIFLLAGALSAPLAQAQSASPAAYEALKINFKAVRYESLIQIRALGQSADGRVIEIRGQVKGAFARDGQRALLFQVGETENIVIDAPDALRTSSATQPGAKARFLCRVSRVAGADIALTLISASSAPEPVQLFKDEDLDAVAPPPAGQTLPPPDQIVIGATASTPPMRIIAGGPAPKAPVKRGGSVLPSRGLPRAARSARSAPPSRAVSPYFGFDESQRTAFRNLARRNNPRLGDEMASYIATSILTAAQAHSLDPRFLAAIVTVESSFDPYCLSSSGAMGLGQLMPFNLRPLGVSNAWDPAQNLNGSAKLLRQNLDTYARQPNGTLLAVAAYHAGVGAVNRAGKAVPPRASTQKYVWKVYYAYRALAPELFPR